MSQSRKGIGENSSVQSSSGGEDAPRGTSENTNVWKWVSIQTHQPRLSKHLEYSPLVKKAMQISSVDSPNKLWLLNDPLVLRRSLNIKERRKLIVERVQEHDFWKNDDDSLTHSSDDAVDLRVSSEPLGGIPITKKNSASKLEQKINNIQAHQPGINAEESRKSLREVGYGDAAVLFGVESTSMPSSTPMSVTSSTGDNMHSFLSKEETDIEEEGEILDGYLAGATTTFYNKSSNEMEPNSKAFIDKEEQLEILGWRTTSCNETQGSAYGYFDPVPPNVENSAKQEKTPPISRKEESLGGGEAYSYTPVMGLAVAKATPERAIVDQIKSTYNITDAESPSTPNNEVKSSSNVKHAEKADSASNFVQSVKKVHEPEPSFGDVDGYSLHSTSSINSSISSVSSIHSPAEPLPIPKSISSPTHISHHVSVPASASVPSFSSITGTVASRNSNRGQQNIAGPDLRRSVGGGETFTSPFVPLIKPQDKNNLAGPNSVPGVNPISSNLTKAGSAGNVKNNSSEKPKGFWRNESLQSVFQAANIALNEDKMREHKKRLQKAVTGRVSEQIVQPQPGFRRLSSGNENEDDGDSEDEEEGDLGSGEWMARFQKALSTIRRTDVNTSLDILMAANAELLHLAQDFLHCARTYGRIIISERFLPIELKTIKPCSGLGGIAGGEKYIVHNVLYKFAIDSHGILGSDYAAAKVAGNELKGLISYFNSGVKELRVPLMAMVDYMGFRLVAMALLPIDKDTLVYGTNDGGRTIKNNSPALESLMMKAGQNINIKSHICGLLGPSGRRRKGWKVLHSPADIEAHLGHDGNFYLLDFSRVMPPELPEPQVRASHLYRLLRPEFVKSYCKPLCSDAFSGFIQADPEAHIHNEDIAEATHYLRQEVIPRFVRENLTWQILEAKEKSQLHDFRLVEAIHAKGLCLRHLGLMLEHVREGDKFQEIKTLLMVEALARVIKTMLRAKLRRKMEQLKKPLEAPYRNLVVKYLNLVFGKSRASTNYWNTVLKHELKVKFSVRGIFTGPVFPLKIILHAWDTPVIEPAALLFARVCTMTGLKLSALAREKYAGNRIKQAFATRHPFDDTDLEEIGERTKHMNIVAEALGSYYHYKGIFCRLDGNNRGAIELFRTAIEKYEEALSSNPTNKELLRLCAICNERLNELLHSGGSHLEDVKFNFGDAGIQNTDQYYMRAVDADPFDAFTLYSYAKFLWRCRRMERAEEYFLQSLEADPNYIWCLRDYGNFLSEQGEEEDAEMFFLLSSEILKAISDRVAKESSICVNNNNNNNSNNSSSINSNSGAGILNN